MENCDNRKTNRAAKSMFQQKFDLKIYIFLRQGNDKCTLNCGTETAVYAANSRMAMYGTSTSSRHVVLLEVPKFQRNVLPRYPTPQAGPSEIRR